MIPIIKQKSEEISRLCEKYRVKSLEVFGSAANDAFQSEPSDIDFLVEFLPGVDFGPWLSHYFDFKDDLEELLGLDVDLVMSNSPAMENTYFVAEVNRSRRLLYAA